ncbi:MAG: translocation/assembly module TamB domain-containing protein, partial [Muribaculaceae bacterium]|nr:translocation/assembly module TamB domain-containing protein [Muribaculaceae bacterium]
PRTLHIHADLDARGDGSRIRLMTSDHADNDSTAAPNDLTLAISDIHIQDWLKINPFAPPIAGDVNADLTLSYTTKEVNGDGNLSLSNLTYGKQPVGNFDLGLNVNTDFGGTIRAYAGLDVNGNLAMTLKGALNDTTRLTPLDMELLMIHFPLNVANPFLPKEYAALSGSLDGAMDVSGTLKAPAINGHLNFRDAKVDVGMTGSSFRLDTSAIAVDSNLVRFNDFAIFGSNENPLKINGSFNMRNFASPAVDLSLTARNMQFLNSKKARNVNLYGRGFINLDATARGTLNFLNVNADLTILPQTNLTYQVTSAKASVGLEPDDDVVRFVNFADTVQVAQADTVAPSGMTMVLDANVDIRQGAQFTVDLSTDGQN